MTPNCELSLETVIFAGTLLTGIGEMMLVTFLHVPRISLCGQKKKHPQHFAEIKRVKKSYAKLTVLKLKSKTSNHSDQSISAFSSAVTPRFLNAVGDKYSLKSSKGKLISHKDLGTLQAACENKIPDQTGNDRELFTTLLDQQMAKMNNFPSSFSGKSFIDHMIATACAAHIVGSCFCRKVK